MVMKSSMFLDIRPCSLWPWRWRGQVPPKQRLTFNGLDGVISHSYSGGYEYSEMWCLGVR
jgi:hypothetical protein